jgi:hypothetical protein
MKYSLLTLAFVSLVTANAFASDQVIKNCNTSLRSLDHEDIVVNYQFKIIKRNNKLLARISQEGSQDLEQNASIIEEKVRKGLTGDLDDVDSLNTAEKLITHAMSLEEVDPEKKYFDTGLDLRAVRSAKVYDFSVTGDMGMMAIVEAKDETGKVLGSYLGGFMVSPCK